MSSHYIINLPESTYDLLQNLANDNGKTINNVILNLIYEHNETADLTTGLDTVPSILVDQLDLEVDRSLKN